MSEEPSNVAATRGPVRIVGAGLLGASIGLGLSALGVPVTLADASPTARALARDVGAGAIEHAEDAAPTLIVVAVPPDVTAEIVAAELRAHPGAVVTDVASVKSVILAEVAHLAARDSLDLGRYVGSHPMAGRERSGAGAASADLFVGRPWVITLREGVDPRALLAVRNLATDLGGVPLQMSPAEHDDAVALVSHLPQLMASLTAGRLVEAPETALGLAGQGLRDVTRVAASDPRLWSAILTGNAAAVSTHLRGVRDDLDGLLGALDRAAVDGPLALGAIAGMAGVISAGNDGVARIPGKHGGRRKRYTEVTVLVPDEPGELGRLFTEIGEIGVNIEDFQMEHATRQRVGMAIVSVIPASAQTLETSLEERGWRVVAQ
ncbi:prephenate dehydrogenase [Occultella glacieicola]|uniref:Prephenate dehydrogenase n=1 Tax=Occultella glacieicola TaxID=2518684 RepID=A0ABY2DWF7_9MICO|nr:prephenate dehydrogenase [Occultella glacieicola]TDE88127.1 prephenate dehydrogenase [Occultella glacieicola]